MIEIPESHTLAHQLSKTVIGKTVAQTIASQSPHGFAWYYGDPADYDARLRGRTIDSAVAHAGYVEMQAGDHTILISDTVSVWDPVLFLTPDNVGLYFGCFADRKTFEIYYLVSIPYTNTSVI